MKIKKLFTELEQEIINQDIYHVCNDYEEDCSQCKFWKKFNEIKQDVLECLA